MAIAQSRVTAQGQISVPAEIRRKLGIGAGSVLEWDEADGRITVRRAGGYTFADIRKELFGDKPPRYRSPEEIKEGIRDYVRKRYARR